MRHKQNQALAPLNASLTAHKLHAEELLAMTERTAGIGCWTLDLSCGVILQSKECAGILSLASGVSLTMDELVECYGPEWRGRIRLLMENCAQKGVPFDEEMQIGTSRIAQKWVRTIGEPVFGRNGTGQMILRVQGALQDISARKQSQQETLRLTMRLTTTLASITEAFVTLDCECCITYLNHESGRLLERAPGELLGEAIWQALGEDVGQRLKQHLHVALATHRSVELEDFYPSLGKWLEVRAYPFTEGLAVYLHDVTGRRKSQEQQRLLETSISRINDIVVISEALPLGEPQPTIVFVNDAFELHTGYARNEVIGKTHRMLLGPSPQTKELRRIITTMNEHRQVRSELRIFRKNGSWFWVELEMVMMSTPYGAMAHWVIVGRDITQRKASEAEIHHLAFYDPLTALPNRLLLLERLDAVLTKGARGQHQGALMFIDVDNFKVLNDTLGHHKGDLLLQKIAVRLLACIRKNDTVARLGGDEFVVMLEDLSDDPTVVTGRARIVAEKILCQLREPFDLDGHLHYATSSIGVTSLNGQHDTVSDLLKQADLAMYQAKMLGRNTVCFFNPDMQAAVSAKARVSTDLRMGLQENQFLLYYQPMVDRSGHTTGVEALLRWQHPQRGLVTPMEFIPVAEESGLILPLGLWVLESACALLAAWAQRPETASLTIAVNVSVRQFRHPDFVDTVIAAIRRSGVGPERLKLELTESLLADRMEITIAKMGILKALGVTLSLDDFGMGYSSLAALKRLPLDQLKIDKSFVADLLTNPHDAAISQAIITLAQSLHLEVVAEGVETQAQHAFLLEQGCEYFQGYLFSRPLPLEQLECYLSGPGATLQNPFNQQQRI